jgi:hypothetical protein
VVTIRAADAVVANAQRSNPSSSDAWTSTIDACACFVVLASASETT